MFDFLTIPLLDQIARSAESLLAPGIESRARLRTIQAEDAADVARLGRRLSEIEAEQYARELELDRAIRQYHETAAHTRYPLGRPGRLRELIGPGHTPSLIISPTRSINSHSPLAVADAAHTQVSRIDGSGQLLRSVVGAFASDNSTVRETQGNLGAIEIAVKEFRPHPSVVVYFSDNDQALITAHAVVSDFFSTTSGDRMFESPVARLWQSGSLEFAIWDDPAQNGPNLSWIRLDGLHGSREQNFGTSIALFAITLSTIYWRLHGVRWSAVTPALASIGRLFDQANRRISRTATDDLTRSERLEKELTELTATHYELQVVEDIATDGTVAVFVFLSDRSLAFFLGSNFPCEAPQIMLRRDGVEACPVALAPGHWNPSHSLAQLVEALR